MLPAMVGDLISFFLAEKKNKLMWSAFFLDTWMLGSYSWWTAYQS
jgi:hypothetical protein